MMNKRNFAIVGLVLLNIVVTPIIAVLFAWIVALAVFSLSNVVLGTAMTTGLGMGFLEGMNIHIPEMPFICALFIGISFFALAVPAGVITEYCRLYFTQMLRKYFRWHRNIFNMDDEDESILPPLPLKPWVTSKKHAVMRTMALVSSVVFVVALVAALASMIIASRSVEPWHVWGWFES